MTRPAQLTSLEDFRAFLREHCAGVPGVNANILYDVELAVDEACTNVIAHGYAGIDPGPIILDLELQTDRIIVLLTDYGRPFDPGSAPEPDVNASTEERELGGFGLHFIRQSVDHLDYRACKEGNTMVLTKYFATQTGGQT